MRQWVWTRHRGQLLPWAAVLNPAVLRTIDDLIVVNLGNAVSESARRHLADSLVVMMRPIRWEPRQYDRMNPRERELYPIITMYGNDKNAVLRSAIEEELMFWTNELTPTAQRKGGVGTTVCIGGIVTFEGPLAHLFRNDQQPVVGCATVVSF